MAGEAPNSVKARANLREICSKYLPGNHRVEVIDVLENPEIALADRVMLTPMLVRLSPPPVRSVIGNLGDLATVLNTLDLLPPPHD